MILTRVLFFFFEDTAKKGRSKNSDTDLDGERLYILETGCSQQDNKIRQSNPYPTYVRKIVESTRKSTNKFARVVKNASAID